MLMADIGKFRDVVTGLKMVLKDHWPHSRLWLEEDNEEIKLTIYLKKGGK